MLPNGTATRENRVAVSLNLLLHSAQPFRAADDLLPFGPVHRDVMRLKRRAVGQEDPQARDVIPRLAILHAAISRGVVPDHAADPAQVLTSGIGSESHSALREIRVQVSEKDTGLDAHEPALRIEIEDAVESGRVQDHAGPDRAAGQGRDGWPRGERHLALEADLRDSRDG